MDAGRQLSVGHLFASGTAVKLLCTTVEQLSVTRLCMTRDLLLLLTLLTQRATQVTQATIDDDEDGDGDHDNNNYGS